MLKHFRPTPDARLDINCFWKPMTSIGPGVREIRVRKASGAYRVIYLATIGGAVHVLHAFQKKTQATAKRDIDLARARLRQIR
jgi:phage-related protein